MSKQESFPSNITETSNEDKRNSLKKKVIKGAAGAALLAASVGGLSACGESAPSDTSTSTQESEREKNLKKIQERIDKMNGKTSTETSTEAPIDQEGEAAKEFQVGDKGFEDFESITRGELLKLDVSDRAEYILPAFKRIDEAGMMSRLITQETPVKKSSGENMSLYEFNPILNPLDVNATSEEILAQHAFIEQAAYGWGMDPDDYKKQKRDDEVAYKISTLFSTDPKALDIRRLGIGADVMYSSPDFTIEGETPTTDISLGQITKQKSITYNRYDQTITHTYGFASVKALGEGKGVWVDITLE